MKTRAEIGAAIRLKNPDTSLDGETRIGAGHPDYEALIERWVDAEFYGQPLPLPPRATKRATLRARWDSLPSWIRGPFRPAFEAANRLLDEGDDDAAADLIRYQTPPPDYDSTKLAVFAAVKSEFAAAIDELKTLSD